MRLIVIAAIAVAPALAGCERRNHKFDGTTWQQPTAKLEPLSSGDPTVNRDGGVAPDASAPTNANPDNGLLLRSAPRPSAR